MESPTPPADSPPVPPVQTPPPGAAANPARTWDMLCHLSALAGLLIPFGNIIGPLVIWLMKRQEFPSVDAHGKEALNFQISVVIYVLVAGVVAMVGMFFCVGLLVLPVLAVIPIVAMVYTIIAAIKASEGVAYRYPLTLRMVT